MYNKHIVANSMHHHAYAIIRFLNVWLRERTNPETARLSGFSCCQSLGDYVRLTLMV